jgi:hypothetical protein
MTCPSVERQPAFNHFLMSRRKARSSMRRLSIFTSQSWSKWSKKTFDIGFNYVTITSILQIKGQVLDRIQRSTPWAIPITAT